MTNTEIQCKILADLETNLLFALLDQQCHPDTPMVTGTTIRDLLIECDYKDPDLLDAIEDKYPYLQNYHYDHENEELFNEN